MEQRKSFSSIFRLKKSIDLHAERYIFPVQKKDKSLVS